MSTLTVQLPDELKARLAQATRRAGNGTARFIRDTLEQRLKAKRQISETVSLFDLTRDLYENAKGGPKDLASNKKHLAGYGEWKT